ncbi:MAG TPA: hypothetical protein DEQ26_03425 [Flavobacteriaceae bacterium]|nr:hypothetical protein [Flavobacteriaceae bacterium]
MRKIFLFGCILCFFNSCYSPKYVLTDVLLNPDKKLVHLDKTFLLVKNNFPFNAVKFNEKVDNDFKSLFGSQLYLQQNFIDFDVNDFKYQLTEDELILIKEQTNKDYLLLLKTLLKPAYKNGKKDNSMNNNQVKREYHIILEAYDLQNLEKIYAKESGSILEFKHEGVSASTTSDVQLEKTFQLLFNDFKNFINK